MDPVPARLVSAITEASGTRAPDLARWGQRGLVVLFGATCLSGAVFALGKLRPDNLFAMEVATQVLSLHGGLAFIAFSLLILWLIAATRPFHSRSRRALMAVASCLASGTALGFAFISVAAVDVPAWLLAGSVGCVQLSSGAVALATPLESIRSRARLTPFDLALTMVGLAATVSGALLLVDQPLLGRLLYSLIPIAAIAAIAERTSRDVHLHVVLLCIGAAALLGGSPSPDLIGLAAGVVLAYCAWRASTLWASPSLAKLSARIAVALFVQALLLRAWLRVVPSHSYLLDTPIVDAAMHLEVFAVVFAAAGRWLLGRDAGPVRRVGTTALLLAAGGAHVLCWSLVAFGKSGSPRRYLAYEPSERLMPLLAAAGATLLMIGLALALTTIVRTRARGAEREVDRGEPGSSA
jgi:hypothetical protein